MAKPTIANPGSYTGQKVGDLRHGWGRYDYPGGIYSYEGEWFEGEKHGNGKLTFADKGLWADCGSEYEGQFLNGEMTGYGVRRWKDASSYAGEWIEGEKHGVGEYTFADGTKYEGQFRMNKFHGNGKWFEPDGTEFEGQFQNHKRTGQGIEKVWDGSSFDGYWENGKRGGFGRWTSASGATYEGTWKDGKRHGDGTFTCQSYKYEGTFDGGNPTVPAGKIVLKTARNDTDDFEPNEVDFMNPVAPGRLSVDATAYNAEGEALKGWLPLDHLVFYVKKPPKEEPEDDKKKKKKKKKKPAPPPPPEDAPPAPAEEAAPAEPEASDEDIDLTIDYSAAPPPPPAVIQRKGIEAGRELKLQLHRWGLPRAAEGEEPSGEPGIQSPRHLSRLVQQEVHKELVTFEDEVIKSDEQGFATCKNLLVYGGEESITELVLVCSDASCPDICEAMGRSESLHLNIDVVREAAVEGGDE